MWANQLSRGNGSISAPAWVGDKPWINHLGQGRKVTSFWDGFHGDCADKGRDSSQKEVPHRYSLQSTQDAKWDGGEPEGLTRKSLNIWRLVL